MAGYIQHNGDTIRVLGEHAWQVGIEKDEFGYYVSFRTFATVEQAMAFIDRGKKD